MPNNVSTLLISFLLSSGLTSQMCDSTELPASQGPTHGFMLCYQCQKFLTFFFNNRSTFLFCSGPLNYVAVLPLFFLLFLPFFKLFGSTRCSLGWLRHSASCPQGVLLVRVVPMAKLHVPTFDLGVIHVLPRVSPCFWLRCMCVGQDVALNNESFSEKNMTAHSFQSTQHGYSI